MPTSDHPNLLDLSVKEVFRRAPGALFRLAEIPVDPAAVRLGDTTLSTREFRADHVFLVGAEDDPDRWALHLEYQLRPEPGEHVLWLIKNLRLNQQLTRPVPLLVVYLTRGRHATFPDTLRLAAGGIVNEHRFATVCLWEHAERIRSGELLELAPLLVLCEADPTEATLRRERELILGSAVSGEERGELLALALAVGTRYFRRELLETVFRKELEMLKEVSLIEEWIQEGEKRGIEQGVEQGRAEGIAEGIERGIEQGIERGIERGIAEGVEQGRRREALTLARALLERRFGAVTPEAAAVLEAASADALRELALRALDAASLVELGLPG